MLIDLYKSLVVLWVENAWIDSPKKTFTKNPSTYPSFPNLFHNLCCFAVRIPASTFTDRDWVYVLIKLGLYLNLKTIYEL